MTDEIKPALTAEEWAGLCVEGECRADDVWGRLRSWHPDPDSREHGTDTPEPDYHALAALCLYQQPFGFTQQHVDLLRDPALWRHREDAHIWLDIASRIAALLPPEKP